MRNPEAKMGTRSMATRIPLQERITPTFNTQDEPTAPCHKVVVWACWVIEAVYVAFLVWLVTRMF